MRADVISVDLPWSNKRGRTAVASRSPAGISVAAIADDDQLVEHIAERAAERALVLLDVPVDGCEALTAACPRRHVDDCLARVGIPILSSVASGPRGPRLRQELLAARPDLRIFEIYPYAVLRVLWALRMSGASFAFEHNATEVELVERWWKYPPRYKREPRLPERRQAMRDVASVLAAIPGFAGAVRAVGGASGPEMQRLADEYDALLGLVAGIAAADASPWSWLAETSAGAGAILTIADGALRRRFAEAAVRQSARSHRERPLAGGKLETDLAAGSGLARPRRPVHAQPRRRHSR